MKLLCSCWVFLINLSGYMVTWINATDCGKYYRESSGTITSPGFPLSYRRNLYCVNTIYLPAGKIIFLKWQSFYVPGKMPYCTGDYVRITRCTSPFKHLIRYCGDNLPSSIFSYENCLKIEFRSANSAPASRKSRHFRLRYETLDTSTSIPSSSQCLSIRKGFKSAINTTTGSQSRLIFTPGWPLTYSGLVPNNGCQLRITLGRNKRVKILFMGIDLYTPVKTRPCHRDIANDVLLLRGVTEQQTYAYEYCGKRAPFAVFYDHSFKYIDVIFVTGSTRKHNHKGFVMGVVVFDKKQTDKQTFTIPLIPTLVSFGIICLLMFCFMQALKTGCHRNAIMQQSPQHVSREYDMTADAYTLPNPPPYSSPGHEMRENDGNMQAPLYEIPQINTPPPPYPRISSLHPPPYDSVAYSRGDAISFSHSQKP